MLGGESLIGDSRQASKTTSIQAAFLSKVQELIDAGKLDDRQCVATLDSWKHLF